MGDFSDQFTYNEIILDSHSPDKGDSDKATFYLQEVLDDVVAIKLVSATIPFTYNVFEGGSFELIEKSFAGMTITINDGSYRRDDFIAQIGAGPGPFNFAEDWQFFDITAGVNDTMELYIETTFPFPPHFIYNRTLSITLPPERYTLTQLHNQLSVLFTLACTIPTVPPKVFLVDWQFAFSYDVGATKTKIEITLPGIVDIPAKATISGSHTLATLLGFNVGDFGEATIPPGGASFYFYATNVFEYTDTWNNNYSFYIDYSQGLKLGIYNDEGEPFTITFPPESENTIGKWLGADTNMTSGMFNMGTHQQIIFPKPLRLLGPRYLLCCTDFAPRCYENVKVNGQSTWRPQAIALIPVNVQPNDNIIFANSQNWFDYDGNLSSVQVWFNLGDYVEPDYVHFNSAGFNVVIGVLTKRHKMFGLDYFNGNKRIRF